MQSMRKSGFRDFFNAVSVMVLFCLFYHSSIVNKRKWEESSLVGMHQKGVNNGRIMQESYNSTLNIGKARLNLVGHRVCAELFEHNHFLSGCDFLIAHPECASGGFFNYIKFFYCDCKNYEPIGFLVLGGWLVILFYLLGNTAAEYFCCSLEKLSDLLKLSPTVAGVTFLPFGNGASDVFAGIANFVSSGSNDLGFDGILGGAIFIACVVGGVVSFSIADKKVQVDRRCFIRDLSFFLFGVACLALILANGKVNIWGAVAFLSIYVVYAIFVALNEILQRKAPKFKLDGVTPMLHVVGSFFSCRGEEDESICAPLVIPDNHANPVDLSVKVPDWVWNTNVTIYSDCMLANVEGTPNHQWGWTHEGVANEEAFFSSSKLCSLLEIPLHLPRRLTIPIVEEDRWSKSYAICSAFLAPVFLAFLWNSQDNIGPLSWKIAYIIGFCTGFILGLLAVLYTNSNHPPRRFLYPWVFAGFFMCIIWSYVIADELVSLLISFGIILGVDPSMLALTVLAWGNSMSDLMSNTALARNEKNGIQMAMSGCFAGPMFNTLVGLGVSLLLGVWSMGSAPYAVPRDSGLFITLGFLAAALSWALIVLPLSDMRPNKTLAVGLITIYLMFLCVRLGIAMSSGS